MSSSLLLSLSSKPSLLKLALRCQTLRTFSPSSTTTNPNLFYRVTCEKGDVESPGVMTQLHMYDPAKEEHVIVGDKPFPKELVASSLVGSSNGWGVYLWGQRSILISDFCNPLSFKSKPKFIPLLLRPDLIGCQAELVSSVAMSSSPDEEEEDYLVAVKFTGRLVSIYKPNDTKTALHFILPHNVFDHFEPSKLMYSKRDQRFYMPSSGGHHLWSWDGLESTEPEFHELRFHNLPQFSPSELQLLDSCHRTHHLVESPSGQRFLVKWYIQSTKSLGFNCAGTKRFMVFREEEDMNMCYTQDIGDLCIFLGDNEPFVFKASLFPGLNPNSIYFAREGYGEGYGVYNIATRTPRSFKPKPTSSGQGFMVRLWAPHWLPPFPL